MDVNRPPAPESRPAHPSAPGSIERVLRADVQRDERPVRHELTVRDAIARQLARLGLIWATPWILGAVALVIVIGLFAAWGALLIAIVWVGGLLGLTTGSQATPFVIGAIVSSGLILFRPLRWAARNLLRVERAVDATVDRLAMPTALDPGTVVERHPTTPAALAALDARLASPPSDARKGLPEEPDR